MKDEVDGGGMITERKRMGRWERWSKDDDLIGGTRIWDEG